MTSTSPLGPVLIGLPGHGLDTESRLLLQHPAVGGVVLAQLLRDAGGLTPRLPAAETTNPLAPKGVGIRSAGRHQPDTETAANSVHLIGNGKDGSHQGFR